jgi:glyoxylase-like metal-dependent hydrolase (beta-lactamase superfamily II)
MGEHGWREVDDRVFVRRYAFFDQNIGAILTATGPVIVDTRSTPGQAREILDDLRTVTRRPVAAVVNTHEHFDHSFGNHLFRPAPIWGHLRCAEGIRRNGERARTAHAEEIPERPELADLAEVVLDPPDRTFEGEAAVEVGGRVLELAWLGRGHTDNDIVIGVRDCAALFAGDLLEAGATPYFDDSYPLDWPATVEALRGRARGPVIPGHGDVGDAAWVSRELEAFRALAALGRRVGDGELDLEAALELAPYPASDARVPLERALAQLRGELPEPAPKR